MVTRRVQIKSKEIDDELFLNTRYGKLPITSIEAEVDVQLKLHESSVKPQTYRDLGRDNTIAEVASADFRLQSGKHRLMFIVPGTGKIGGKSIKVKILKIEDNE